MSPKRSSAADCVAVPAAALRGQRWDPAFWGPRADAFERLAALPCRPLGEFIEHITYGPIVTGQRPSPSPEGVLIIDQRAVRPTGVVLDDAITVREGCVYDVPRCRLRPRDVVLCRSGAGTLARRRFTVFDLRLRATVSCFVDLIRLQGLNPYYAVTFLRSPLGWGQIERLINGVGTPNLSFAEIRSLLVPELPVERQAAVEESWQRVRRLHRRGALEAARAALDQIAARLDGWLRP
ncbi:MAG: hypothetical protein ACODAJ_06420 [Planctomycetota bacterium]